MHPSLQESLQEYSNPNCLLGLEYLNPIDQLLIHQEVRTGCETANKFTIKNSMGQRIFYAVENSDCCEFCMQENRSYLMKIVDTNQHEVIELIRPSVTCKSPEVTYESDLILSLSEVESLFREWKLEFRAKLLVQYNWHIIFSRQNFI